MATTQDPSSRAAGQALVVAQADLRAGVARVLKLQGMTAGYADDPYAAMGELCRRPLVYRTVVLSLQAVYQEELHIVSAIKRRFPHIEVYLSHTDGRQGAMADGMRLGADGIVSDHGIHHTSTSTPVTPAPVIPPMQPIMREVHPPAAAPVHSPVTAPVERLNLSDSEPLLSAEELRALLDDEPAYPPAVGGQA